MNKKTRQFLLTGPPGCGKTTLVKKVCESLKKENIPVHGFYTEELRVGRGKRQGFDVVTLDGHRAVLARVLEPGVKHNGPIVGQYGVNTISFEQAALPVLSRKEGGVVVIDEIGKMELFSKEFCDRVSAVFQENTVILATVPNRPLPFITKLRASHSAVQETIEVNQSNRNNLEGGLVDMIRAALSQ